MDNSINKRLSGRLEKKSDLINITPMPDAKVLIVDDIITNYDVAKVLLEPYMLKTIYASSGRDAIELIRSGQEFDIIFMDHMMPEIDGVQTTSIIRNELDLPFAKSVPIVALTANAIVGMDKFFMANGFSDYLSKPLNVKKLDECLHRFISPEKIKEPSYLSELNKDNPKADATSSFESKLGELFALINISGFDVKGGLDRFGGNGKAFLSVITSFVKTVPEKLEIISSVTEYSISTPELLKEYETLVHGVKGSCYGISLNDIGNMAYDLEMAAKSENRALVLRNSRGFAESARISIGFLERLVSEAEAIKADILGNVVSEKPDDRLLLELKRAAEDFDTVTMLDCVEKLGTINYYTGGELVTELSDMVHNFDYTAVVDRLSQYWEERG